MKEIYYIIGKLINSFQILENNLELLLYDFCYQNGNPAHIIKDLTDIDKKTLGKKLSSIKQYAIFEDSHDISILKFLNEKRRYIVHYFFADNDFSNQSEIESHKQSLLHLLNDVEMINKALLHMIADNNKNSSFV